MRTRAMGSHPRPNLRRRLTRVVATLGALGVLLVGPAAAVAHPLGNFTINHYLELHVAPDALHLDVVIDEAEIPAFQSRQELDLDADGELTDAELETGRAERWRALAPELDVRVDDASVDLTLDAAGLTFPVGASGLQTMRLVCAFSASLDPSDDRLIQVGDGSMIDRLGWREIVVTPSGVALDAVAGEFRTESVSDRLTAYPEDRLARPLADASVTVRAVTDASVPTMPFVVADAVALRPSDAVPSTSPSEPPSTPASPAPVAVPGGIGGEVPAIFGATDLTPVVLLLSLVAAAGLGAGHALTPGHGKTLMAAYLVGTRGTAVHALGLGLAVSVSHTLGILVLAAVVVGASDVLPPDVLVRTAPLVAAVSIVAIGVWVLLGEWRRRRARHGHDHEHDHVHEHVHEHSHGGATHRHVPTTGSTITWRSLFVLGLAGGHVPSTSALLILLGAIAAGRPAFGMVLVVAFGHGMAAVMAGIGLVLVAARERVDRLPTTSLGRVRGVVPLVASVTVFAFGVWLTAQAVAGTPAL